MVNASRAGGAAHDFKEHDPVMRRGCRVQFVHRLSGGVDGGVEAKGQLRAAHVVVDGFGHADDVHAEFGHLVAALQSAVATDGYEGVEFEFAIIADNIPRSVALALWVPVIMHVGKRIVAIGRAQNGAALREDAGNVLPAKPTTVAFDKTAKGIVKPKNFPTVHVEGGLDHAAHDRIKSWRVAAAG